MKRNRFSEMIPSTPADFHGAVADALNRMEAVERRHRAYTARIGGFAAAAAAVVLVVCLAVMMPKRLPKEDIVTSPNTSEMVVRPTEEPEQVSMEIGAWQVADDGSLTLEWTMTATDEETLLVCGDAKLVFASDVPEVGDDDFSLDDGAALYYRQIGKDILGDGNGTVLQCTGRGYWDEDGIPVALAIHYDVYSPTVEPVDHSALDKKSFENQPGWVMHGSGSQGSRWAMPIDWHDGTHEFQTCYGSELVDGKLSDFRQAHYGQKAATPEEALEFLQKEGALRTALLEGYDFGEHVKSFDFIVDLTAGSGVGADVIEE